MTMTDQEAAEAIRAHHDEMSTALRRQIETLATAIRAGDPAAEPRSQLLNYLEHELMPHAAAEEKALYPAADRGTAALLMRAMRNEHVDIVSRVDALRGADDGLEVLGIASAILALFESHLAKENDLVIPSLVADPGVSLGQLLGGMHELLG